MWETAYDVTTTAFDCNVNRTKGDSTNQLYTINHFLDTEVSSLFDTLVPDKSALDQTNAANGTGSLGLQAEECGAQYGRSPNFMLVDVRISCLISFRILKLMVSVQFYEYGNGSVFEVAATLNGVTYAPTSPIATPITGSSTSSSTSSDGSLIAIPRGLFAGVVTLMTGMAVGAWTVL